MADLKSFDVVFVNYPLPQKFNRAKVPPQNKKKSWAKGKDLKNPYFKGFYLGPIFLEAFWRHKDWGSDLGRLSESIVMALELPETNLKIGHPKRKRSYSNIVQPSIFQVLLNVSFREGTVGGSEVLEKWFVVESPHLKMTGNVNGNVFQARFNPKWTFQHVPKGCQMVPKGCQFTIP